MRSINIVLLSSQPIWAKTFCRMLTDLDREMTVTVITFEEASTPILGKIGALEPDLILLALSADDCILVARQLRTRSVTAGIVVLTSHYVRFGYDELCNSEIDGIMQIDVSPAEAEQAIVAQVEGYAESLPRQYLRVLRMLNRLPTKDYVNEREREILQLVASDMSDKEIADVLSLSVKTVGSHLRHIYAKLGVRGRAGAVAMALMNGSIETQNLQVISFRPPITEKY